MSQTNFIMFGPRGNSDELERGIIFQPKFDGDGLIPAIVTDAGTGAVLMFAYMNRDALQLTLTSGFAHFWSRSRGKLWKKGEDSGNTLAVENVFTDCDQDVVLVSARIGGQGHACHTGASSCFYRRIETAPIDGLATLGFVESPE